MIDNMFISGGNPHLTSWFCEIVLSPTTIFKMVSEHLQDSLGHMLSGFCYGLTYHLCPRTKLNCAGCEGCVKSPTSNRRLYNMFISGDNPHLISRFYGNVLGLTTISKNIILSSHLNFFCG